MTYTHLKAEALKLPQEERADLARDLITSLESRSPTPIEQLWIDEARRRSAEVASGAVEPVPAAKVLADARARLR